MSTPPRFYCPIPLSAATRVALPEAAAHHASRALRLREGDSIVLFNGDGAQYLAQLRFDQGKAMADVTEQQHTHTELPGRIGLVQGLPSGDKMDWIIEKAAELGVTEIFPIRAERSIVQLTGNRLEKRQIHWQRIAESASEQSGRNCIVQIHPLQTLSAYLQQAAQVQGYMCHPEGGRSLVQVLTQLSRSSPMSHPLPADATSQDTTSKDTISKTAKSDISLRLLIGPEGGWSQQELQQTTAAGIEKVTFGERILRTETAGLAMTAAAIATLGWV